jgi:hypothetical protein
LGLCPIGRIGNDPHHHADPLYSGSPLDTRLSSLAAHLQLIVPLPAGALILIIQNLLNYISRSSRSTPDGSNDTNMKKATFKVAFSMLRMRSSQALSTSFLTASLALPTASCARPLSSYTAPNIYKYYISYWLAAQRLEAGGKAREDMGAAK